MSEKNTPELQVATRDSTLELKQGQSTHEPSVGEILLQLVSGGITQDNMQALQIMCDLKFKTEDRDAAREFARSFAGLQAAIPRVQATKGVPGSNGEIKYYFAPFEELMRELQPFLTQFGFSVRFSTVWDGPRLLVTMTLTHIGGHSEQTQFGARVGEGPPKASPAQADGAVLTYAKRMALCSGLNIVIDKDDDGRGTGDPTPITASQAADLRAKCEEVGADKTRFLSFSGAATFEAIQADKLDELWDSLERKARK